MRQLIGKRFEAEGTPRSRLGALPGSPAPLRSSDSFPAEGIARSLQELVSEADKDLSRAISNHGTLQDDLKLLAADFKEVGELFHNLESNWGSNISYTRSHRISRGQESNFRIPSASAN